MWVERHGEAGPVKGLRIGEGAERKRGNMEEGSAWDELHHGCT